MPGSCPTKFRKLLIDFSRQLIN